MGKALLTVQARALRRAADILGGKDKLRAALHVPMARLDQWLSGVVEPPMDIFLKAVDIISTPARTAPPTAAAVRARVLTQKSGELIRSASRRIERARLLREPSKALPKVTHFLQAVFAAHERSAMLDSALDAAIEASSAQMGNVQLAKEDGLHIVAQRGFREPFLTYFACVRDMPSPCATAFKRAGQVVVSNVAADPIFQGTEAASVMEAAGARACQSTPLVSVSGQALGVLNTHYDHVHTPEPEDLDTVTVIARRAAYWLEQATA